MDQKGGNSHEEDEFFDANDNLCEAAKSEAKFVPLHEELNQKLHMAEENDDEDEKGDLVSDEDPYLVDEELLKAEDEKMDEEERKKKLDEALENKRLGNESFKAENYKEALELYTKSLQTCPFSLVKDRSIIYSNRSACFYKMKDYERCIKECTRSIELDGAFVKPLVRRADCFENTDKLEDALADYKRLAEVDVGNNAHKFKCKELEEKIKDRNEKLKEEMMGKLKDLGNMLLKPLGLSTDNFQFVQDPNTGSYSVNFNKQ